MKMRENENNDDGNDKSSYKYLNPFNGNNLKLLFLVRSAGNQ